MGLQKIVVLCVVVVVIGGGAWYVMQSGGQDDATGQTETTSMTESSAENSTLNESFTGVGSFMDLIALGDSFKCNYTVTNEEGTMSGTSYVDGAGERYRMDGTGNWDGQSGTFSAIMDGTYMYWWGETPEGKQGMKIRIPEQTETTTSADTSASESDEPFDVDQEVDYDCSRWSVDNSVFLQPTDVEFTDMEAMMNEMMQGMPEGFQMPEGFDMYQQ